MKRACSEEELGLKILRIGVSRDGTKLSHISVILWSIPGNGQRKSVGEARLSGLVANRA
jgi:hypothetical protein